MYSPPAPAAAASSAPSPLLFPGGGESNVSRGLGTSVGGAGNNGVQLSFGQVQSARISVARLAVVVNVVSAGQTVQKLGLYTVDKVTGALTLVGATANAPTQWQVLGRVVAALVGPAVDLVQGDLYAVGAYSLTGTAPTFIGAPSISTNAQPNAARRPRQIGSVFGVASDLPANIADAAIDNAKSLNTYCEILPA